MATKTIPLWWHDADGVAQHTPVGLRRGALSHSRFDGLVPCESSTRRWFVSAKAATLTLLLCSCAGPTPSSSFTAACVTDNMLVVLDPVPPGWCDEVQGVEDRIFEAFRDVAKVDDRFRFSKARTRGWAIVVVPELSWSNTGGTNVIGQTDCDNRVVYVNNNRPAAGPLGHELAHAVENCKPLEPWDLHDYYHSNWAPIYAALRKHNLRP